ncbi:MAG: hypothetical protein ACXW0Q_01165 [Methylovulum sp.]
MKTQITKKLIAIIATLYIGALQAADVNADTVFTNGALIYNNRAYVHAIQGAPNPEPDRLMDHAEIVYVNKGYGQAIYSYPRNVPDQRVTMNMEYVNPAYGQAIYSYPNNNKQ